MTASLQWLERVRTGGRVIVADCVVKERSSTIGRVDAPGCVDLERPSTVGRVQNPRGVEQSVTVAADSGPVRSVKPSDGVAIRSYASPIAAQVLLSAALSDHFLLFGSSA